MPVRQSVTAANVFSSIASSHLLTDHVIISHAENRRDIHHRYSFASIRYLVPAFEDLFERPVRQEAAPGIGCHHGGQGPYGDLHAHEGTTIDWHMLT